MFTPNQLNLIADKLRTLRGRIHAELATTLRQSDSAHANDLRQQLKEIAADLQAIEEEHAYLRAVELNPVEQSKSYAPGLYLDSGEFIPARDLAVAGAIVVMATGELPQ